MGHKTNGFGTEGNWNFVKLLITPELTFYPSNMTSKPKVSYHKSTQQNAIISDDMRGLGAQPLSKQVS